LIKQQLEKKKFPLNFHGISVQRSKVRIARPSPCQGSLPKATTLGKHVFWEGSAPKLNPPIEGTSTAMKRKWLGIMQPYRREYKNP
jgi:hypothetical protein